MQRREDQSRVGVVKKHGKNICTILGHCAAEQLLRRRLIPVGDICTEANETVHCKDRSSEDRAGGANAQQSRDQ